MGPLREPPGAGIPSSMFIVLLGQLGLLPLLPSWNTLASIAMLSLRAGSVPGGASGPENTAITSPVPLQGRYGSQHSLCTCSQRKQVFFHAVLPPFQPAGTLLVVELGT